MHKRLHSLRGIASTVPRGPASSDSVWTRFVLRPLSIPLTALLLPLGVSANAVTYFGIVLCLAAAFLLGSGRAVILGAALFNLFAALDCIDGNVARVRGVKPYGAWVDALGGYVAYTAVLVGAGVAAERMAAPSLAALDLSLAGAVAATSNLLMRVAHQSYLNATPAPAATAERVSFEKRMSENLGITGLLMPAVLAGAIWGVLGWVVLFYACFYGSSCAAVILRLAIRVGRAEGHKQ